MLLLLSSSPSSPSLSSSSSSSPMLPTVEKLKKPPLRFFLIARVLRLFFCRHVVSGIKETVIKFPTRDIKTVIESGKMPVAFLESLAPQCVLLYWKQSLSLCYFLDGLFRGGEIQTLDFPNRRTLPVARRAIRPLAIFHQSPMFKLVASTLGGLVVVVRKLLWTLP